MEDLEGVGAVHASEEPLAGRSRADSPSGGASGAGHAASGGGSPSGSPLAGSTVVLGVSGGVAAYKAVELCRRMVDAGAHVVPVLTSHATRFVGEATFSALASEPARTSLWHDADPIPHTRLGQAADAVVVAPATANLIGRYVAGIADDLLSATLLATRAAVVVCPAMHTEMWEHPAVRENLERLRARGTVVVEPEVGRLAGGDVGAGRLAEPEAILAALVSVLEARPKPSPAAPLAGRRVLVSAGGTREPIDPVRYIGNRSSGKQGHAVADEAAARGAEVTLVTTAGRSDGRGVKVVNVETAEQMAQAVLSASSDMDVVVMAAAVADFRPKEVSDSKIRKDEGLPEIILEPTMDILAELASRRSGSQVLVGFAAETGDVERRAEHKLAHKGVDIIVANDVTAPGAGFEHDTNTVVLIDRSGKTTRLGPVDKRTVAAAILDSVTACLERGTA